MPSLHDEVMADLMQALQGRQGELQRLAQCDDSAELASVIREVLLPYVFAQSNALLKLAAALDENADSQDKGFRFRA